MSAQYICHICGYVVASSHLKETKMESKDENNEEISLPPDTLAILQEFLENKRLQESFESNSGVFEEDWV